MPIASLPTPPSRTSPGTFSDRADTFLGALPGMVTEINAVLPGIEAAADNAAIAQAAADTAVAAANSTKWVSGISYAEGVVVWSPLDFQSYRRTVAGAGTTDPSLDEENWTLAVRVPGTSSVSTYQSMGGL